MSLGLKVYTIWRYGGLSKLDFFQQTHTSRYRVITHFVIVERTQFKFLIDSFTDPFIPRELELVAAIPKEQGRDDQVVMVA